MIIINNYKIPLAKSTFCFPRNSSVFVILVFETTETLFKEHTVQRIYSSTDRKKNADKLFNKHSVQRIYVQQIYKYSSDSSLTFIHLLIRWTVLIDLQFNRYINVIYQLNNEPDDCMSRAVASIGIRIIHNWIDKKGRKTIKSEKFCFTSSGSFRPG